jgi:hypothetical protein
VTSQVREPDSDVSRSSSEVGQDIKVKISPSYLKVTIANIVCPGYGAWISGSKIRGANFFFMSLKGYPYRAHRIFRIFGQCFPFVYDSS